MSRTRGRHTVVLGALVTVVISSGGSVAIAEPSGPPGAAGHAPVPELVWTDCGTTDEGTAAGVQCATAGLPMDYDDPHGDQVQIALARVPATDPANRIGSLFMNFGGPGGAIVDYLQTVGGVDFATLNRRFDLVGFDPRGTGQSVPAVDCRVDQEALGIYSQPVPTPLDLDADAYVAKAQAYVDACLENNGEILEHLSTANVARDMDALRAAVADERLTYLGFSYGTFLGATYAALFPDRYRALVLDGAVDADEYVNDPISNLAAQTAGFERSLSRFLEACAVDQVACSGFGGTSPSSAYDDLIAAAETAPIPAAGYAPDPRPVDGDDIRWATLSLLYAKQLWGDLALALSQAAAGDGSTIREIVDVSYGRRDDGTFDPSLDRYFTIGASEQQYPEGDVETLLDRGAESWASFPHFWLNSGYAEVSYALWPARDEDAFLGPFTLPESAPAPLVVGTTYDPATPYEGALRLVQEFGNASLLTMDGDTHTAYAGQSACVDAAVEDHLFDLTTPAVGTVCPQEVPFAAPEPVPAEAAAGSSLLVGANRLDVLVGRSRR
jgi:pimeloyl-ACP methyl ester carboxylesterase